jgi:hypothetical protein
MSYKGYRLNIWDVGGQKTLRSYWRNYYEATDGMVWVVDSADVRRLQVGHSVPLLIAPSTIYLYPCSLRLLAHSVAGRLGCPLAFKGWRTLIGEALWSIEGSYS